MALSVDTAVGAPAPRFALTGIDGKRYDLDALRARGPVLAGFFKETCPTCQLAWPFVERLHAAYQDKGLQVVGISQGDKAKTQQWGTDFHATHPLLVDEGLRATVDYGLVAVPTLFLIDTHGDIVKTQVGWNKAGFEDLSKAAAKLLGVAPQRIVRDTDDVPAAQAG